MVEIAGTFGQAGSDLAVEADFHVGEAAFLGNREEKTPNSIIH